MLRLRLVDDD